jgi:hypothetical protein
MENAKSVLWALGEELRGKKPPLLRNIPSTTVLICRRTDYPRANCPKTLVCKTDRWVISYTSALCLDPERRSLLRAALDACYARLYGLGRDDLRYILDPENLMGKDYPSETFRVLKEKEIAEYGEFRTQRPVLETWDGV